MRELYTPPVFDDWKRQVLSEVENLELLPKERRRNGPIFRVATKDGQILTCETQIVDPITIRKLGGCYPVGHRLGGEQLYLIAKNSTGEIIGTEQSTLRETEEGLEALFIIKVIERGRGFATPIEEAHELFLQYIADEKQKPVIAVLKNKNLENLEEYKLRTDADPDEIVRMEQEQARWQELYGPKGRFPSIDGKRVFFPRNKAHSYDS